MSVAGHRRLVAQPGRLTLGFALHLVLFLGSGGGKCPVSSLAQYYCGLSSKHWLHARLHARRAAYYAALFTAATNRAISRESCGRAQGARSNLSHAAPEMIFGLVQPRNARS